jgi:hypothetical protein
MSFVDAVGRSIQDPFGSSIVFLDDLGTRLEGEELAFVCRSFAGASGLGDHRVAFAREEPFDEKERYLYECLPDESKLAVLAFDTMLLHEVTHQIDTTMTPFAGMVHMLQVEEFLRLTPLFEGLVGEPEIDISEPLVRSALVGGHPVRERLRALDQLECFEELLILSAEFRALDAIGAADVTAGWCGKPGDHPFLGEAMERVTLFGKVLTIRRRGAMRPVTVKTVLETRALSNCLRRILRRFRDDLPLAAREMCRYVDCFYPANSSEYRGVLDAVATFFGYQDIQGTIEGQAAYDSIRAVDQPLVIASLVCWAGLHSWNVTERLILAADFVQALKDNQIAADGPKDFLDLFDAQQSPTARDALDRARELVREQRKRVPAAPRPLAAHFLHVLDATERRLTARIDRDLGLGDPVGTPNCGNPALYMSLEQADDVSGAYRPPPEFAQWSRLRTLVLHRQSRSQGKRAAVREWLSAARA